MQNFIASVFVGTFVGFFMTLIIYGVVAFINWEIYPVEAWMIRGWIVISFFMMLKALEQ